MRVVAENGEQPKGGGYHEEFLADEEIAPKGLRYHAGRPDNDACPSEQPEINEAELLVSVVVVVSEFVLASSPAFHKALFLESVEQSWKRLIHAFVPEAGKGGWLASIGAFLFTY